MRIGRNNINNYKRYSRHKINPVQSCFHAGKMLLYIFLLKTTIFLKMFKLIGRVTILNGLFLFVLIAFLLNSLTLLYPIFRLLFGTLYPAYASYKTVKTKNVKEYVKWMMYWIVFALFTTAETFTDVFLSWLPFYYEIKIVLVLWLLSPATKGSSILYRKFVHPTLSSKEQEIDEYISKAKEQGYKHFLDLGQRGVSALMQTAIKNINLIPNSNNVSPSLIQSTQIQNIQIQTNDQVDDGAMRLLKSQSAQYIHEMFSEGETEDLIQFEVTKNKKPTKTKGKTTKSRTTRRTKKTEPESD